MKNSLLSRDFFRIHKKYTVFSFHDIMHWIKKIILTTHVWAEKVSRMTLYFMSTLVCLSWFLYVLEKLFWLNTILMQYTKITSFYQILEIGLIVLIFSKIHTILDNYLEDSKIRVLDLIEISITTLLLEMVFHRAFSFSSWTLLLLLMLLVFFVAISVLQKKWLMQSEMSEWKK